MRQFSGFQASQLFCSHCKKAVEVREVLLLVLPGKNLYDYRCRECGNPVGKREEADPQAFSLKPRPRKASKHADMMRRG